MFIKVILLLFAMLFIVANLWPLETASVELRDHASVGLRAPVVVEQVQPKPVIEKPTAMPVSTPTAAAIATATSNPTVAPTTIILAWEAEGTPYTVDGVAMVKLSLSPYGEPCVSSVGTYTVYNTNCALRWRYQRMHDIVNEIMANEINEANGLSCSGNFVRWTWLEQIGAYGPEVRHPERSAVEDLNSFYDFWKENFPCSDWLS